MLSFMRRELGCLILIIVFIVCIIGVIVGISILFSIDYEGVRQAFVDWYNHTIESFRAIQK